MSLTTLSLTLCYLFIHYSQLEFRNLDFFIPCRSLYRKILFKLVISKFDIIRPRFELFNACGGSGLSLCSLLHNITLTFSFTPLGSSFGIWIFLSHVVAYLVSFHSRLETRKSDIIRPRYEVFNACGGSCPSLPCLWHYVTFSFTTLSSSFGIWIFSSHVVA